ncbi:MAG: hypothetical protein AAFZ15_32045 [Bacteroidota bacterium]
MKKNSATRLLSLLTEEELRKFSKYLRSPYFNNTPELVVLFEQLRKWHPAYEEQRIRPHIIWKKLKPGTAFSTQKYWWMNFKLGSMLEQFMVVEELLGNKQETKKQLIKSYGRRNVHKPFAKETKALLGSFSEQPFQDIQSYASSMWLKHDYFFSPLTDKYGGAEYSVEDIMDDLDRFYILAKMRFACEIKNRERIFKKHMPIELLEECVQKSSRFVPENPAYLIYRNVLDLFNSDRAQVAFQEVKIMLNRHHRDLSRQDQNEILLNLRNYAISQVNKGKFEFASELFQLFKMGIELDLLVNNGKMSQATYQNIVQVGSQQKEYEWVEKFINSHDIYLDEGVRMDNKLMSLGLLHFEKGEFDNALDYIAEREFASVLYQMIIRITISKIWFEKFLLDKSLADLLLSKLETNEKYCRRISSVSEQRREVHLNFILALKFLSNLIINRKSKDEIRKKMQKYLGATVNISSKKWLLEKIE